ncbi:hypothetical protein Tco_0472560 [Tanacetum coccineum]
MVVYQRRLKGSEFHEIIDFSLRAFPYSDLALTAKISRKRSSIENNGARESVSKQGRKFPKGEPTVHKDPLFDEIPEDSLDYMETEDAQDEGRTRDEVDEKKENAEDVLSTAQQKVSTDKEKVKN